MDTTLSPLQLAAELSDYWSPKIIGELDNNYLKVAKVKGELAWHSHEDQDELFYILKGSLTLEMRDRTVELNAGEVFVVPKGVEHNPLAEEECLLMLIEQKSTLHTGTINTSKTRSIEQQLLD